MRCTAVKNTKLKFKYKHKIKKVYTYKHVNIRKLINKLYPLITY